MDNTILDRIETNVTEHIYTPIIWIILWSLVGILVSAYFIVITTEEGPLYSELRGGSDYVKKIYKVSIAWLVTQICTLFVGMYTFSNINHSGREIHIEVKMLLKHIITNYILTEGLFFTTMTLSLTVGIYLGKIEDAIRGGESTLYDVSYYIVRIYFVLAIIFFVFGVYRLIKMYDTDKLMKIEGEGIELQQILDSQ